MSTKICYACRSEVDFLAKVCPHCHKELAMVSKPGQVAGKPTKLAVGCLAVVLGGSLLVGIIGVIVSNEVHPQVAHQAPPPEPIDPKYGKKPDRSTMMIAIRDRLRQVLHDPSSLDGPDVDEAIKATIKVKGKPVDCWRVDFRYRAKNAMGALVLNKGTYWMKGDQSIRVDMD